MPQLPLAAALAAMSPEDGSAALAAMSPQDRASALAAMAAEARAAALSASGAISGTGNTEDATDAMYRQYAQDTRPPGQATRPYHEHGQTGPQTSAQADASAIAAPILRSWQWMFVQATPNFTLTPTLTLISPASEF